MPFSCAGCFSLLRPPSPAAIRRSDAAGPVFSDVVCGRLRRPPAGGGREARRSSHVKRRDNPYRLCRRGWLVDRGLTADRDGRNLPGRAPGAGPAGRPGGPGASGGSAGSSESGRVRGVGGIGWFGAPAVGRGRRDGRRRRDRSDQPRGRRARRVAGVDPLAAEPGRLPRVDGRTARVDRAFDPSGSGDSQADPQLRGRRDVRRVSGRPLVRVAGAREVGARRRGRPPGDLLPLAAPVADGRLQLHELRSHGDPPRAEPVHDDPGPRAAERSDLPAQQLAPAAQPLRAAVHDLQLRHRPARRGRRVLGPQGQPDDRQPGDPLARLAVRRARRAGPVARGGVRRAQPARPGLGGRRRPQRLLHGLLRDARLLPPAPGPGRPDRRGRGRRRGPGGRGRGRRRGRAAGDGEGGEGRTAGDGTGTGKAARRGGQGRGPAGAESSGRASRWSRPSRSRRRRGSSCRSSCSVRAAGSGCSGG